MEQTDHFCASHAITKEMFDMALNFQDYWDSESINRAGRLITYIKKSFWDEIPGTLKEFVGKPFELDLKDQNP